MAGGAAAGGAAAGGAAAGGGAVRFGVLAPTSMVARLAVVPAIVQSGSAELVAVASRSVGAGSVPVVPLEVPPEVPWLGGYEDVLGDKRVEAVYIPLPNSMHREWVERAADAGKHVLCEKPLGTTAADATAMARRCKERGVVLMEAYMTLFHPRSRAIGELCASGSLGELLFGSAAFTGELSRPDDHRWRPEMGGGALLDVGIYCLVPLLSAAGVGPFRAGGTAKVASVTAVRRLGGAGVDSSFSGLLSFDGGATSGCTSASFQCSFEAPERQYLEVVGTKAALLAERAFTPSLEDRIVSVRHLDGSFEELESEGGDPYLAMVEHFCEVVRGRAELEWPASHSVALAGIVDRLAAAARHCFGPES